jgi:hypothetical protein
MYYVFNYEFRPELLEDKMSADTVEACSAECALRNRFFSVNKHTKLTSGHMIWGWGRS